MVNEKAHEWSHEEAQTFIELLKKMECNNRLWLEEIQKTGKVPDWYPVPQAIYEAHAKTKKSPAIELGIFDERGCVFLTKRPSKKEAPDEPFADEWHIPGVMLLPNERIEEGLRRLTLSEIGRELETVDVGIYDMIDDFRPALSLLKVAEVPTGSLTETGRRGFYALDDLPFKMIAHHRDVLLPMMEKFRREKSIR